MRRDKIAEIKRSILGKTDKAVRSERRRMKQKAAKKKAATVKSKRGY